MPATERQIQDLADRLRPLFDGHARLWTAIYQTPHAMALAMARSLESEPDVATAAETTLQEALGARIGQFASHPMLPQIQMAMLTGTTALVEMVLAGDAATAEGVRGQPYWRDFAGLSLNLLPIAGGEAMMEDHLEAYVGEINQSRVRARAAGGTVDAGALAQAVLMNMTNLNQLMTQRTLEQSVAVLVEATDAVGLTAGRAAMAIGDGGYGYSDGDEGGTDVDFRPWNPSKGRLN
jgi:hypothetical protein